MQGVTSDVDELSFEFNQFDSIVTVRHQQKMAEQDPQPREGSRSERSRGGSKAELVGIFSQKTVFCFPWREFGENIKRDGFVQWWQDQETGVCLFDLVPNRASVLFFLFGLLL